MSTEFKSPTRKRSAASKSAAKERRAEKLLSQTQEEAETIRSQDRERINASREEESQEKTAARRGQERERSSASREEESQEEIAARRGQDRERRAASREEESQEETDDRRGQEQKRSAANREMESPQEADDRRGQEQKRSAANRSMETPEVTTARQRQVQGVTAARRERNLEETAAERRRRDEDLVREIEDSLADLSTEPPINVLEAFESDARIARMLFWENTGVYQFDSLESDASDEAKARLKAQLESAIVTTDTWGRCWENFYSEMDPAKELHICAVCCERRYDMEMCKNGGVMTLTQLQLLRVNEEQSHAYFSLTEEYRKAYTYYNHDGVLYHLLSFLRQPTDWTGSCSDDYMFPVCKKCHGKICEDKLPEYSLADGHDYGNPRAVLGDSIIDSLSIVDDMCIAKNRMFANIIKLLGTSGSSARNPASALKGHVISFSHEAPKIISERAKTTLPNTDSLDWIRVCFIGSKNNLDRIKNTPSLQTVFSVNGAAIMNCLKALKVINERYADIAILEDNVETATLLSNLQTQLAENIMSDASGFTAAMEEVMTSDIANVRTDSPGGDFEHMLISSNHVNGHRPNVIQNVLESFQTALASSNTEAAPSPLPPHPTMNDAIQLQREANPLNEFIENDAVFLDSFPLLFFLGKGWKGEGSVSSTFITHLMSYYDGRFQRSHKLMFALFDQMMRHTVSRKIKSQVMVNHQVNDRLTETLGGADFNQKLAAAIANPKSAEATALFKSLLPILRIGSDNIPFSPMERSSNLGDMYSMAYYFGSFPWFWTMAPNDTFTALTVRICIPDARATDPADSSSITGRNVLITLQTPELRESLNLYKLVADNPVAAAEIYQKMKRAVFKHLMGIELDGKGGTKKSSPVRSRPPGVLGVTVGACGPDEGQVRGTLHFHGGQWGGIPPWVLEEIAEHDELSRTAGKVIDSMVKCSITPVEHCFIKARKRGDPAPVVIRGATQKCPDPRNTYEFCPYCNNIVGSVNMHAHKATCCKPPRGCERCRLCYDRAITTNGTHPQLLETNVVAGTAPNVSSKIVVSAAEGAIPPRNKMRTTDIGADMTQPLPARDERIMVWEVKRPGVKNITDPELRNIVHDDDIIYSYEELRNILNDDDDVMISFNSEYTLPFDCNGAVVDYNPLLSSIMGCNTAIYMLGTEEQARVIMHYMMKYIVKDGVQLAAVLTAAKMAIDVVQTHPTAYTDDAATESVLGAEIYRRNKQYCNCFVNAVNGAIEIPAQLCASSILQYPSFVKTHSLWRLYFKPAMAYTKRMAFEQEEKFEEEEYNSENEYLGESDSSGGSSSDDDSNSYDVRIDSHDSDDDDSIDDCGDDFDEEAYDKFKAEECTALKHAANEGDDYEYLEEDDGNYDVDNVPLDAIDTSAVATVYEDASGLKHFITQEIHYAKRGKELEFLNLYEYCGIVTIVSMSPADKTLLLPDDDGNAPDAAPETGSRRKNARYLFSPHHPQYKTHMQMIRSKLMIPRLVGVAPKYPGFKRGGLTVDDFKSVKCRNWAAFILTLFAPWDSESHCPSYPLTWEGVCAFLRTLAQPDSDWCYRATLHVIRNLAAKNSCSTFKKQVYAEWRNRGTKTWKELQAERRRQGSADGGHDDSDLLDIIIARNAASGDDAIASTSHGDAQVLIDLYRQVMGATDENGNTRNHKQDKMDNFIARQTKALNKFLQVESNPGESHVASPQHRTLDWQIDEIHAARDLIRSLKNDDCDGVAAARTSEVSGVVADSSTSRVIVENNPPACAQDVIVHNTPPLAADLLEPDWSMCSFEPKDNQRDICRMLHKQIVSRTLFQIDRNKFPDEPPQMLMTVLGGAGAGKSAIVTMVIEAVTHTIQRVLIAAGLYSTDDMRREATNPIMLTATTGAAATVYSKVPCSTFHSALNINTGKKDAPESESRQKVVKDLTSGPLGVLQVKLQHIAALIIDEVSMLPTSGLANIAARVAQGKGVNDKPFGGLDVILVGDFSQMAAVGESLYTGVLHKFNAIRYPSSKYTEPGVGTANFVGRGLFAKFDKHFVHGNLRSGADRIHAQFLEDLCDPSKTYPITKEHIDYLKAHQLTPDDMKTHKFQNAIYGVTSNDERLSMNKPLLQNFVKRNGGVVVRWEKIINVTKLAELGSRVERVRDAHNVFNREEFTGPDAVSGSIDDWLYQQHEAELYQYFVIGASCPVMSTQNVSPKFGIANGTMCNTYGLMFSDDDTRNRAEDLIANAGPNDIVTIPCPIYALLEFSEKTGRKWPPNRSLVPGAYVMAFDINTCKPHYKLHVKTVTPGSSTINISYNQFKFEMGLVTTLYKLQGATVAALVVELNGRPGGLKALDLRSLFVALSRVEDGKDFRIFPLEQANSLDYLYNLKRDNNLDIWYSTFDDNGKFVPPRPLENCNYIRPPTRQEQQREGIAVAGPALRNRGTVRSRDDFRGDRTAAAAEIRNRGTTRSREEFESEQMAAGLAIVAEAAAEVRAESSNARIRRNREATRCSIEAARRRGQHREVMRSCATEQVGADNDIIPRRGIDRNRIFGWPWYEVLITIIFLPLAVVMSLIYGVISLIMNRRRYQ
jgi:hypothetical protein